MLVVPGARFEVVIRMEGRVPWRGLASAHSTPFKMCQHLVEMNDGVGAREPIISLPLCWQAWCLRIYSTRSDGRREKKEQFIATPL